MDMVDEQRAWNEVTEKSQDQKINKMVLKLAQL